MSLIALILKFTIFYYYLKFKLKKNTVFMITKLQYVLQMLENAENSEILYVFQCQNETLMFTHYASRSMLLKDH